MATPLTYAVVSGLKKAEGVDVYRPRPHELQSFCSQARLTASAKATASPPQLYAKAEASPYDWC